MISRQNRLETKNKKGNYKIIFTCILVWVSTFLFSQIEKETATTNRKYEPDVQKLEKKQQSPEIPELEEEAKKQIQYQLEDVEPVSDFETSALPPEELENLPKEKLYNNYIQAGYGNYNRLFIDGYGVLPLTKENEVGITLYHQSTTGINDFNYNAETDYAENKAQAFFNSNIEKGNFHADIGYHLQSYNLFGSSFPEDLLPNTTTNDVEQKISDISAKAYYDAFANNYFDKLTFETHFLGDNFDTKELGAKLTAKLDKSDWEAEIGNLNFDFGFNAKAFVAVTNTEFKEETAHKFNYFHIGAIPLAKLTGEKVDITAGAKIEYLSESETSENDIYITPSAYFLLKTLPQFEIFGGIQGGITTQSYHSLLETNLYLLPNQTLLPSRTNYNIYGGIQGELTENLKYKAQAGFSKAENITFFKKVNSANPDFPTTNNAFNRFNTFEATYDDGNIFNIQAEINYLAMENLSLGLSVDYNGYDLDNYDKILNTPNLNANLNATWSTLQQKLTLTTDIFFVSERETNDFAYLTNTPTITVEEVNKSLDSYIDANLKASYSLKPNLSLFIKGMNLFNADYENYVHYSAQGIQVLGGVLFKF